jgi:hypothetical protein
MLGAAADTSPRANAAGARRRLQVGGIGGVTACLAFSHTVIHSHAHFRSGLWLNGRSDQQYENERERRQRAGGERNNLAAVRHLTDQDLKDIGVLLGHRRIILAAIGELAGEVSPAPKTVTAAVPKPQDPAERRQVSVVFSDLFGSTALSALKLRDNRVKREQNPRHGHYNGLSRFLSCAPMIPQSPSRPSVAVATNSATSAR